METEKDDALYTLEDAVQFLETSKPTLYRLLSQGDLRGLKVGRQWRFRKADLVAYMERGPVALAAAPPQDLDAELEFFAEQLRQLGEPMQEVQTDDAWPGNMDEGERKTVQLAYAICKQAIILHASDIHLEPTRLDGENVSLLRLRVDGVLHEIRRLAFSVHEGLIARFKIMADMNIADRRAFQNGRIPIRHADKDFDFHSSVIPTAFGGAEAITMRVVDRNSVNFILGLDKIDLDSDQKTRLRGWLERPHGLLLFAGPVGSGKTTTALSCLDAKARPEVKTMTIEGPVEYLLPYTTQVQLHKKDGVTFASALRSLMGQDPDIIYVSELADMETAQLAVRAALNGHLVLSTLPTGDAPTTLAYLLDMGLEPHLVAATVVGVVAQRLCRKLCEHCKEPYQVSARDLLRFGLAPDDPGRTLTLYRGKGCEHCRQRGYLGRVALFETLEMTEKIVDLIVARASQSEIAAAAQSAGMNTLRQAGLSKVLAGITTPEEVLRVTFDVG